ncbi:HNH endonuclease signature motif containing protein [Peribacillus psychrosaccharolyticus]|uniref:HNH endonuclease signature motif containing protein n=1 Tax=Peribacillus psychrosaccharolyticus TaxID=1407 RepID=UPI003D286A4F
MSTLSGPRQRTIKRLYALSGNVCAFPKCNESLVTQDGILQGEICHIKARSEGGMRYDINQSDEERHGFNNLVLLCSRHHNVIDSVEASYTVERLLEIKREHEERDGKSVEASDEIVNALLLNMNIKNNISFGGNFNNGQLANVILNYNIPTAQTKNNRITARRILVYLRSVLKDLEERRGVDGVLMTQVRKMPNFDELYVDILEYLHTEQASLLIDVIEKIDSLNHLITEFGNYCEKKGINLGLPIMHAGFRSYQNGYNSLIDEILQMNLQELINQLEILSNTETE